MSKQSQSVVNRKRLDLKVRDLKEKADKTEENLTGMGIAIAFDIDQCKNDFSRLVEIISGLARVWNLTRSKNIKEVDLFLNTDDLEWCVKYWSLPWWRRMWLRWRGEAPEVKE